MKKKIGSILFCLMLVIGFVLPVSGEHVDLIYKVEPVALPLPGCIEGNEPIFKVETELLWRVEQPELVDINYNEDIANLIQSLDEEVYLEYLEDLVAFGPRVTQTEECEQAGGFIYEEFEKLGLEVRRHYWESESGLSGFNVEGTLPGLDETSDEIYIVCAHYDSVPGSPGADDDGSGTVAVMSAAKLMSHYAFNHTIRFIAFSGEEQGLHGSYHYAKEASEKHENIGAVLNVDMIGFAPEEGDDDYVEVYHEEHPLEQLSGFTAEVAQVYNDFIDIEVIPSGYSWGSDHYYFWEYGYQAIFYAELNFNYYYHSPEDVIENMNINYAVRNSRLTIATLAELSEITEVNSPDIPSKPAGQTSGKNGEEYTYSTSTTDPQGEQVFYWWDWGDGSNSGWLGPFESGDTAEASHTWENGGNYSIKVKVKDINDFESDWSDPLSVTMPRNKPYTYRPFLNFLQNFLQNHPNLFPILRLLLQRVGL